MIVGATNRPGDVDRAILRRMPSTCSVKLPNSQQREDILKAIMQKESIEGDVEHAAIAAATDGYSGSDLVELCRNTAMTALRQHVNLSSTSAYTGALKLTTEDFLAARSLVENALEENASDDGGINGLE